MTQEEYIKQFIAICDKMITTTKAKNGDYADKEDAFSNFKMIEQMSAGRISVADGIIVRLTDKLKRILSLLGREGQVKTESIQDTALDMAVYSVILYIWLDYQNGMERSKKETTMV